jgi:hypothetical protein
MEKYIMNSFIKNHSENTFNNIKKMIQNELRNSNTKIVLNDAYLSYIFEIATYEYCGIESNKIPIFISRMGNNYIPSIEYTKLKEIHKDSINKIKYYLEQNKK